MLRQREGRFEGELTAIGSSASVSSEDGPSKAVRLQGMILAGGWRF